MTLMMVDGVYTMKTASSVTIVWIRSMVIVGSTGDGISIQEVFPAKDLSKTTEFLLADITDMKFLRYCRNQREIERFIKTKKFMNVTKKE